MIYVSDEEVNDIDLYDLNSHSICYLKKEFMLSKECSIHLIKNETIMRLINKQSEFDEPELDEESELDKADRNQMKCQNDPNLS
jgi:hypothetical protein